MKRFPCLFHPDQGFIYFLSEASGLNVCVQEAEVFPRQAKGLERDGCRLQGSATALTVVSYDLLWQLLISSSFEIKLPLGF